MKCQFCGCLESKVIDSRPTEDGRCIRRRRECIDCHARFTTYEKLEAVNMLVIKKDETREAFDIEKIKRGIIQACHKRPISAEQIEEMVYEVEQFAFNHPKKEINSHQIGEKILEVLKKVDDVAYIRFASVYNHFEDAESFVQELEKMIKEKSK